MTSTKNSDSKNLRCDFCYISTPKWAYPCEDFVALEVPGIGAGSKGGWAACDTCSSFIEKGDYDGLTQRLRYSLHITQPELPLDEVMPYFKEIYRKFADNRTGPRKAIK